MSWRIINKIGKTKNDVLGLLEKAAPETLTTKEIADALPYRYGCIKTTLWRLVNEGRIKRVYCGVYKFITYTGFDSLSL